MAVSFNISELKDIADQLTEKLNLPFNQMTHSFLKRRLTEVMDKQGIRKLEQLFTSLDKQLFRDDLPLLFSVSTTELFRDASFWRQLRKLITNMSSADDLQIWLPDLASGEELYSLLILLDEIKCLDGTKVYVNHPSQQALENVKQGLLFARKMDVNAYNYKRFEGEYKLENYYEESNSSFVINAALLKHVVFSQEGMLSAPNGKVDIILLRNRMLYYTKDYHLQLKDTFDRALKPGGLVCLGVKEALPEPYSERFECIEQKEKIYSKYSFIKD